MGNDLMFGGERGVGYSIAIYAGPLDEPSMFHPTATIFTSGRPDLGYQPPALRIFERAPD
jgi:hypothetical protein